MNTVYDSQMVISMYTTIQMTKKQTKISLYDKEKTD